MVNVQTKLIFTAFTAVNNIIPIPFPFFSPRKWSFTTFTNFVG